MSTTDMISGLGVLLILIPFFLGTFDLINDKSKTYFVLNLLGGGLAFCGSIMLGSLPFAVLEGTWTLVAAIGLLKAFRRHA
jgi:hypothetical protein